MDVKITDRPKPHCIAWARATASLWGIDDRHELDEPVKLSDDVPVRLRAAEHTIAQTDRELSFTTLRAGHHLAIRFYFDSGKFLETEVQGVNSTNYGETIGIMGTS